MAAPGAYEFLSQIERLSSRSSFSETEAEELMRGAGISDVQTTLADLVAANVLGRVGDGVGLTTFGMRTLALLDALNGGDVADAYARLARYDPSLRTYELVREGMTRQFLENLRARPGFRRLYLCSPWISFEPRDFELLRSAITQAARSGQPPELFVITRPIEGDRTRPPRAARDLQVLGATVFLHQQLHTKLYIREPGVSGGFAMAIMGSQNLTRSRYLELGIRINADNRLVDQLITYFWDITNGSVEV
jgi:hypothetical protein